MEYLLYLAVWFALSVVVALIVGPIIDRMGRLEDHEASFACEEDEDYRWNDHQ